jgi:hypothetical protein
LPPVEGRAPVVDLEPVSRAVVVVDRPWRLGHVQRNGPLVVHGLIQGKGKGVPGGNGRRDCARARVPADIASQVVGREAGHWRVHVGVLPQVLVHGKLLGADRELLEDVVARHFGRAERQCRENGAETLHGGGLVYVVMESGGEVGAVIQGVQKHPRSRALRAAYKPSS